MEIYIKTNKYSECPKSGCPDFGVFEKRLVVKSSGFQNPDINVRISNVRFIHLTLVRLSDVRFNVRKPDINVRFSDVLDQNRFQISEMSEIWTIMSGFRTFGYRTLSENRTFWQLTLGRSKTGCLKFGQFSVRFSALHCTYIYIQ